MQIKFYPGSTSSIWAGGQNLKRDLLIFKIMKDLCIFEKNGKFRPTFCCGCKYHQVLSPMSERGGEIYQIFGFIKMYKCLQIERLKWGDV